MRAPAFWWRPPGVWANLLRPFAALYGAIAGSRMQRAGARAGLRIVCVGDFTLGGAGKTPTAIMVAHCLAQAGERPMFLTRGHGGRLPGPMIVDAAVHDAAEVGDEPLLLARHCSTIVSRDRIAGAQAAHAAGASIVVMDDGFQNPALAKDFTLVVVDGARGVGNGLVFPAGPLRAPLRVQLARADALVIVGPGEAGMRLRAAAQENGKPVFDAVLEPDPGVLEGLRGRSALAFAGIGHPEKFFQTLVAAAVEVAIRRAFPDHHPYTAAEAQALLHEAEAQRLMLVTTEKDHARLARAGAVGELRRRSVALPVTMRMADEEGLRQLLLARLGRGATS